MKPRPSRFQRSRVSALQRFHLASSLFAAVTTANAQSTWDGDTSNNWGISSNWNNNTVPNAASPNASAIFTSASPSGYDIFLGGGNITANITFNSTTGSTPYTIKMYDTNGTTVRTLTTGSITVQAGSHTIEGPKPGSGTAGSLILQNNTALSVSAGATLTLDARLRSSGGSNNYTKTGAGTLILNADNGGGSSWSFGTFSVNAGIVRLNATNSSGFSGNTYTVASGAAIELNANFGSVNGAHTISGSGIGGTGVIRSLGGNRTFGVAATSTGSLTLAANSAIGVDANSLNIGLAIGESGGSRSLTKVGAGLLTLSNANTFSGSTTISAGILSLTNLGALQNSALNVADSVTGDATNGLRTDQTTLNLGGLHGNKNLADVFTTSTGGYGSVTAITLTTATGKYLSYSGALDGSRSLTVAGSGVQALSGTNSYTGGTSVTGGVLSFVNTNAKSATGTHAFGAGTTLGLGIASSGSFFTATDITNAFAGTMTGNLSNVTIDATTNIGIDTSAENLTYTANNGSSRGLAKLGNNTLTLTGPSTYTGGTNIYAGTLQFAGTSSMSATGAVNVLSGATLAVNAGGAGEFTSATSGNGSIGGLLAGLGGQSGGTVTYTGNVALGIDTTNAGGSLTYSGAIANPTGTTLGLTKLGTGTLVLTTNGSYTGPTNIMAGILQIGNGAATGTLGSNSNTFIASGAQLSIDRIGTSPSFGYSYAGQLSGDGTVNVLDSRRLNFTANQTSSGSLAFVLGSGALLGISHGDSGVTTVHLGELSGGGNIQRAGSGTGGGTTLVIGGKNTDSTYSGAISGTTGNFSLEKVGTGSLTLASNNTYTGTTTVTGGTLVANGNLGTASQAVTVGTNGTLGGSGTIAGATTVNGNLTPGTSAGVLSFSNSLALAASSSTTMEITGTGMVRGTDYDGINVGTSLGLNGDLVLDFGTSLFTVGVYVFDLFNFTGSLSGNFSTVALWGAYGDDVPLTPNSGVWSTTTNVNGGETWSFSQATGDLTLTVIPEPRAALLGGIGVLLLLRRRRH